MRITVRSGQRIVIGLLCASCLLGMTPWIAAQYAPQSGEFTADPQGVARDDTPPDFPQPDLPNIIYILGDDMGWGDLGSYGTEYIKTPILDKLSAEGRRFVNASASAVNCSPSRIAILTGQYPYRLNFQAASHVISSRGVPDNEITVADVLRSAGYATAHVGKWHIGQDLGPDTHEFLPTGVGFDTSARLYIPTQQTHWDPLMILDEQVSVQEPGHSTDALTKYALQFLNAQTGSPKPFFLNLWYYAPHLPMEVPPQWVNDHYGEYDPELPWTQYAAMVTHMDFAIGQLLDKLDQMGVADNTLVIFTSDNGGAGNLGLHPNGNGPLNGWKGDYEEGGMRVPFVARWPGVIPADSVDETVVMGFDLLPTVLDILGTGNTLPHVDGQSLMPLLTASEGWVPRTHVFPWTRKATGKPKPIPPANGVLSTFAVRRDERTLGGQYLKLIYDPMGDVFLFDLVSDPGEVDNIASKQPDDVQELWEAYWTDRVAQTKLEWKGTPEGAVSTLPNGYDFSGGVVSIPPEARYDFHDGHFTVGCRFRLDSVATTQALVNKTGSFLLQVLAGGQLTLAVQGSDGSTIFLQGPDPVLPGEVHVAAFTVTRWTSTLADNTVTLYHNGTKVAEDTVPAVTANRNPVLLGNNATDGAGSKPLYGLLLNTAFYVQALLPEEFVGSFPPLPNP